MNESNPQSPKLTAFSHGGGCGCKVSPGLLSEILADRAQAFPIPRELLVGIENSDDAAVYQINEQQALVATTDFFTPIVDDPFDFGRIAAANAISDVYAMGAQPILALAVVGMPIAQLSKQVIALVLEGGQTVCAQAGIPIAGGHTIDTLEPIYGLVVLGLVAPERVKRNGAARSGDVLVLGKPLGIGILTAALKRDALDEALYRLLVETATQLNTPGPLLARRPDVHAMTDVTGFGLFGHLLEMCRGSGLHAELNCAAIPVIDGVWPLLEKGFLTGASGRNWSAYGASVEIANGIRPDWRDLLADPQTNGGLLVACEPSSADAVVALFHTEGFHDAAIIGRMQDGVPGIRLR